MDAGTSNQLPNSLSRNQFVTWFESEMGRSEMELHEGMCAWRCVRVNGNERSEWRFTRGGAHGRGYE
jgi:hypothetical protein